MRRKIVLFIFLLLFSLSLWAESVSSIYCSLNFFNNKSTHERLEHIIIDADIDSKLYFNKTYETKFAAVSKPSDPIMTKIRTHFKNYWGKLVKSKMVSSLIHKHTLNNIDDYSDLTQAFTNRLKEGKTYNFIISDKKIAISGTSAVFIDDLISKHMFLASHKNVAYAGDFEVLPGKVLRFTNNSGTYKPDPSDLALLKKYLDDLIGPTGFKVETQAAVVP
jgi:hypothetical protein